MSELASEYVILWASQTGNAERVAKNVHSQARRRGFTGQCVSVANYKSVPLQEVKLLILITSNTRDGDPPDSAIEFWKFLRSIDDPAYFAKTRFTVLGLGDRNYPNFNATGKRLEKKMNELGGQLFYPKVLADSSEGLDDSIDPWLTKLWEMLPTVLKQDKEMAAKIALLEDEISEFQVRREDIPYTMENRKQTLAKQVEKYLHLENSLIDNYTMEARKQDLPKQVLKYTQLDNSLVIADTKEEFKGFPLNVYLNKLEPWTTLKGLPRVAVSNIKLVPLHKKISGASDKVPEFVPTPTPIIYAPVTMVSCLTTSDAVKRTLEVELDIGKDAHFEPGDAFGVLAPNDEGLVQALLKRLNASSDELYRLEGENLPSHLQNASSVTLADLFRYGVDLTGMPRKALFRMLADHTSDPTEKLALMYLSSKQGISAFNAVRDEKPNLYDILISFPSSQPPIEKLLDLLPAHLPRLYSISSSPLKRPGKIRFAFNVVEYTVGKAVRKGVATPWLDKITNFTPYRSTANKVEMAVSQDIRVPMFIRPNANAFVLPESTERPLVLIGPGTGIAPFIGFLEHRQTQRKLKMSDTFGPIYVYYGYRDKNKDYLFREELEGFEKDGTITRLALAESRAADGSPKTYVQDLIRKDSDVLYDLIVNKDGAIYICGDAKGMAKGVQDALASILAEHQKIDVAEANKILVSWIADKKYLRDLWA